MPEPPQMDRARELPVLPSELTTSTGPEKPLEVLSPENQPRNLHFWLVVITLMMSTFLSALDQVRIDKSYVTVPKIDFF